MSSVRTRQSRCEFIAPPKLIQILENQKHPPLKLSKEQLDLILGNSLLQLEKSDSEKLWHSLFLNFQKHIYNLFPDESRVLTEDGIEKVESLQGKALEFMEVILQLAQQSICVDKPHMSGDLLRVMMVIQGLLLNPAPAIPHEAKAQASRVCELWCKKRLPHMEAMARSTFQYLLIKSFQDDAKNADIIRVWQFREALTLVSLRSEACKPLGKLLLQIPKNVKYLKSKEGQKLLSFVLTLDPALVGDIHGVIKEMVPTCTKAHAEIYGQVYYWAWNKAAPPVKKVLETSCVQDFMDHIFLFQRHGLEMNHIGQNVFTILKHFHSRRNYTHLRLMLATLYEPLLWRHLSSGKNIVRCNAAQVLLDAYPLEKPGQGREENDNYLNRQHAAMTSLLTDRCHIVRIIATRQLCAILSQYWLSIPNYIIQNWMKIIMRDLANDASTADVRRSVYQGLKLLLPCPHAVDYLGTVLCLLRNNFHDVSEKVRLAFTDLLIAIKDSGQLKFWKVVPLDHLVSRLAIENELVGKRIVELIFDSFFVKEMGFEIIMKRISNLIMMNSDANRKFFQFSKSCLPLEAALDLMLLILPWILEHVRSKMELNDSKAGNTPSTQQKSIHRSRKKKLFQGKENMNIENEVDEVVDVLSKPTLENPRIAQGVLDIVCILWSIHSAQLETEEYTEQLKQLYTASTSCLPYFLRYYSEDNSIFSSVLYICSMIPINILKPFSTVESCCLSKLRRMTMSDSDDHCLMLVMPLCMWGRGADILEMARGWLNDAFRIQDLNDTIQQGPKIGRRVHFRVSVDPKPLVGLRLLDAIFSHPPNKAKVIKKNYENVMNLFVYLNRVKIVIHKRMETNEPHESPLLSDEFLRKCFLRYLKLIVILKSESEEDKFDPCDEMSLILEWARCVLIPNIPAEMPHISTSYSSSVSGKAEDYVPLSVEVLKDIMLVISNMLAIGRTTPEFCVKVGIFAKELLCTGCKLAFLFPLCLFMEKLVEYNNAYYVKDEYQLFRVLTVSLSQNCLSVLAQGRYEERTVTPFIEKIKAVKTILFHILHHCVTKYKQSSELSQSLINSFTNSIIGIIKNEMMEVGVVNPVHKLPFLATTLLGPFQQRTTLSPLLISALQHSFKKTSDKDPLFTLSTLCLLQVLAFSPRKMVSTDLKLLLKAAEKAVKIIEQSSCTSTTPNDSSVPDIDIVQQSKSILKAVGTKLLGVTLLPDESNIIDAFEENLLKSTT